MRMNRMAALTLSAGLITMAACSDSPTAPIASPVIPKTTSFAVGDVVGAAVQLGKVIICKTGNVGGTFNLSNQLVVADANSGSPSASQATVTNGTCEIAAEDANPINGNGTRVTITEVPAANTVQTLASCAFKAAGDLVETPCSTGTADLRFINAYHGYTITYNNVFTPPPTPHCTYTKGWYRNNGSETVTAVDGRTKAQAQAIFDATPGKPGSVTWEGDNNTLNLYQQLLAALLNGGASGPAAVQTAITQAQAATGGTGTNITLVGGTDVSGLIATLSSFNEGNFANYPHCE
jgi:hypothetical protein